MKRLNAYIILLPFILMIYTNECYAQHKGGFPVIYSTDSLKMIAKILPYEKNQEMFRNNSWQLFSSQYKGDSLQYLFTLAYAYFLNHDFVNAVKYSLHARIHFSKTNNKETEAELTILTGNSYQRLSYTKKAIYYYLKAIEYRKNELDIKRKNRTFIDIGNCYLAQDNMDSALFYYRQANESAQKSSDSVNLLASLVNLGNLYLLESEFSKAEEYTNRALVLNKVYKLDFDLICKYNLGQLYFQKKAYLQARMYFAEALDKIRGSRYESLLPEIYKHRAIMDYETGNYEFAIQNCRLFLSVKDEYQVREYLVKSVNSISSILVQLIDRPHAKELLLKNLSIMDSLTNADYEVKRWLEESFEEIALLEKNYKILEQENLLTSEKINKLRLIFIFTVVFLVLISIGFFSILKARNKIKKQNEIIINQLSDLTRKNVETSELNARIKSQAEKISLQNEHLTQYQDQLEHLIEQRTNDLSAALLRVQESDRLKTSFLQNISHEIRTPLNAISGFSQLLTDDSGDKSKYIDYISQNVFDLIDMVENIMIFSKIHSNQVQIKYKVFLLKDLVEAIKNENEGISFKYKDKNIKFVIDNQQNPEFIIKTDFSLFKKILIQLIDNSYKFTETGHIVVRFKPSNGMLEAEVSDSGIGIKHDQIPFIFDTFRKIEGEHKLFRGTGIGLSIVKNLVEMLNGTIRVESELGKGTTMCIKIPVF